MTVQGKVAISRESEQNDKEEKTTKVVFECADN
jgi:hypothetical protein